MANYIVESHQAKIKAIEAAQLATAKKYEEKLKLLGGSTSAPPAAAAPAESKLFQERSEKVAAAAKAGKSRWGDAENAKAAKGSIGAPPVASAAAAPAAALPDGSELYDKRNARIAAAAKAGKSRWGAMENDKAQQLAAGALPSASSSGSASNNAVPVDIVEKADHGLRADGGVSGPSLMERLNLGAELVAAEGQGTAPAPLNGLYDKRNARVAAAAAAGKSRWGPMENDKAKEMVAALPAGGSASSVAAVSNEIIEKADHGLRADGGVSGPSLADRVNLGAALVR